MLMSTIAPISSRPLASISRLVRSGAAIVPVAL
jgi:hypothetical protein